MSEPTGMYLENAEKFVAAMKAMPTEEFLRGVIEQASILAYNEAKLRPTPMAHTYGNKRSSSSGNVATPGKSFWQRGRGGYYKPAALSEKTGKAKRSVMQKASAAEGGGRKVSSDLTNAWRRDSSLAGRGRQVDVHTTGVKYAGFVQGGRGEEIQQTKLMHDRGWQSVDDVAKKVEEKISQVVGRTMKTFYIDWLAKYGITAT